MSLNIRSAFAISLALNLLLAVGIISIKTASSGNASGITETKALSASPKNLPTKTPANLPLATGDTPRNVRDALRAAGISETLVRRFVGEAVWDKYNRNRDQKSQDEWWKDRYGPTHFEVIPNTTVRSIKAEIEDLVGEDIEITKQKNRLAFLPEAKRAAMTRIFKDYEEMSLEISADMMNFQMPEDQKRQELLTQERDRDLKALLTPEEFNEVTLLQSPAGQRSRMIAGQLDLTEAEFREVVKLRREADRLASDNPTPTSSQSQTNEKRFEAALTRLVGEERMKTQSLKNSRDYEVLQKAQERLGLSQAVVDGVLAQRDHVQNATTEILTSSGSAAEKRAALKTLATGVKTEVTQLLGPAATEGYFRQSGMSWLWDIDRGMGVRFTFSGYAESIDVK